MEAPLKSPLDPVRRALAEDLGSEELSPAADVTSTLALPAGLRGRARVVAKGAGVLAGTECAVATFRLLDPAVVCELRRRDGQSFAAGDVLLELAGLMRPLLAAERTALNFLQRLSGIATATRAFVDAVAGTKAVILDTRKTTPGLRLLEKAAVVAGGGANHRIGLFDQVLLKENHFAFARPRPYLEVVQRCVAAQARPVVAEARTLDEGLAAVRGGAAVVLLDNFRPGPALAKVVAALRDAARAAGRDIAIEASGGVTLANVRAFADSGVDRISVGAITHSAPAIDLSLLVEGA
ncbi:MAG: carboxylating nicotinate-nucleotide diphosphorylase [Planctomycetota bacterium]